MLIATYMGKIEYMCTDKIFHRFVVPLCNIWSWFLDFASSIDYKNQMSAINKAD